MDLGSNIPITQIAEYNAKLTSFFILSCMIASVGGIIYGYDIGISSGVTSMDPFLKKFFPSLLVTPKEEATKTHSHCLIDRYILTAFTSSLFFVGMFASLTAALFTQKYGRRATMMIGGAAYLVGAMMGGAAFSVWMLIFGRVLLGFGVGFTSQAIPLYISEMAPPKHRGKFITLFRFSQNLGFQLANLIFFVVRKVERNYGWRLSLALPAVPAFFLTLGTYFLPETPASLIQQGQNHQNAIGTLQRVRGTTNILTELNDIVRASFTASTTSTSSYRVIGQKRYIPQLVIVVAISFFSQMTGFNLVVLNAPTQFARDFALEEAESIVISAAMIGMISLFSDIIVAAIIDRVGRRILFLAGGSIMLIPQIRNGGATEETKYLMLSMTCFFIMGFEISWGILGWLVPSEIFPLEIRSIGHSLAVATRFMFSFVVAQSFQSMHCVLGGGMFFFFAVWIVVMTAFVYLMLPEMKEIPIEQMEVVWRHHWFWKRTIQDVRGGVDR